MGRARPSDLPYGHDGEVEVRFVQPYQAHKRYVCPGCERDVPAGHHHVVVIPVTEPDFRRHWHRGCWERVATRHRTIS